MDDFEFKDEIEDDDFDDFDEETSISFTKDESKEETEENSNTFDNDLDNKTNIANKKFTTIVITTVSILCGILVFVIVYLIFNPKEKPEEINTSIDINNQTVQELYKNITYGMNGIRYEKFIKEPRVTLDDFSNYEKYYYALSFIKDSDFQDTGSNNQSKTEIYSLSSDKIASYMRKYFGDDVTYEKKSSIVYTFQQVNKMNKNTGTLKYDDTNKKYTIVFTSRQPIRFQTLASKKYFAKLAKANQVKEDEIELIEDIIYTRCDQNQSRTYSCNLFKDYENTVRIGEKVGVSADTEIDFEEFENHTQIIYRFKKSMEGNYVFKSSKIKYSE